MLELLIVIGRALALWLCGHRELVFDNLALRQQLAALKRTTNLKALDEQGKPPSRFPRNTNLPPR